MLQTNNTGMCSQFLSPTRPAPARGAQCSGSTLLHWEPSEAGPKPHAPPRSKPLRFGAQVALRGADSVGPPRSEYIRCLASAVAATYNLSRLCCSVFWVYRWRPFSGG